MDRIGKSWPWRKKPSDRNMTRCDIIAAVQPDPSKLYDERSCHQQDVSRILSIMESKSDNAMARWQQAEEKLKEANEKLILALSDNTLKDDTIKQHSKVAEEAVLGWEKAKAEAADLKVQLDSTLQKKAVAEDQLSQIDGALKECMLELRHVKEVHEKTITEVVMQNTRQCEKISIEFEAKITQLNQQVLESEAENKVLSRTVQERGSKIVELTDGKSQAEAKISVLHIQLGMMEKENSSLTYELNVLSKELEIRNEEREYRKRELEVSNRQTLENAKKIAKLEADCQKLRVLVRRKLPGPAAIAQMKLEVESLGYEADESRRRRAVGKSVSSSSGFSIESIPQRWKNGNKDMEMLLDRMHGMEEETKMLREILAQKNGELQAARLLCARTATRLSSVESHLEAMSSCSTTTGIRNIGLDPPNLTGSTIVENKKAVSVVSIYESSINHDDQASCADNWTPALVSELSRLEKDKVDIKNVLEPSTLKLMDDFTEMEHLASKMESEAVVNDSAEKESSKEISVEKQSPIEEPLLNESELQITKELCKELRSKLSFAENELSCLQKQNHTNEATIIDLQEKLDLILETQVHKTNNVDASVQQVKASVVDVCDQSGLTGSEILSGSLTGPQPSQGAAIQDTQAEVPLLTEDAPSLHASSKRQASGKSQAKAPIHKAFCLIEALALAVGLECRDKIAEHIHEEEEVSNTEKTNDESMQQNSKCEEQTNAGMSVKTDSAPSGMVWDNIDLDQGMQRILTASDKLIQWDSFVEFMQELSIILEVILAFASGRERETCNGRSQALEGQNNSLDSVGSAVNKNDEQQIDIKDKKMLHLTDIGEISISNTSANEHCGGSSEAYAVEFDMIKDYCKFAQIQEELVKVKSEKQNFEQRSEAAMERVENLKTELHDAHQLVMELKDKLLLSQVSEQSTNREALLPLTILKSNQKSEVKLDIQDAQTQEKLSEMQLMLQKEQKLHEDALLRIKFLEEEFNRVMSNTENSDSISTKANNLELFQMSPNKNGKLQKGKEIAAATKKLDECQKTILVLGTQLKALASPHDSPDESSYQIVKSPCRKQNYDPFYYNNAEIGTAMEVDNSRVHYGQQLIQGHGWSKFDRDQELESQWSPRRCIEFSPDAPRGQAGVDFKIRKNRKRSEIDYFGINDTKSPDKSGYFDEVNVAASPSDELQHTPANSSNSSVRYGVVRKTGASISDLSKAFQAVQTKSPSGKHGSSGLSRFFSRSKNQTK